jgi:hypothetical protein
VFRPLFLLTLQRPCPKAGLNGGLKPAADPPHNQVNDFKPRRLGVMETPEARGLFFWLRQKKIKGGNNE